MLELFQDFLGTVIGRLIVFGVLALPFMALFGYWGLLPARRRRRPDARQPDSHPDDD
ncbi:hypothetical protein [Hydrogenophaga sp. 5NK40-0174]|uniref:hypothetical protein n=1 Tax=Hydrogenophaga sp. 5NK40-0174 TaxID=3127649 RepID=UPI003342B87A